MKSERSFRKQASAGRGSRIIAAAALAVMITIAAVFTVSAYDPAADPIVTVSYLNEVFRSSIHSELLNEMGFESYEDLKEALSKAVVDEDEIVSAAKAAVLKSFGYSSWSSAKSAFTATTITQADRQKIADEAIAQLMESLNIASTDELREKLETVDFEALGLISRDEAGTSFSWSAEPGDFMFASMMCCVSWAVSSFNRRNFIEMSFGVFCAALCFFSSCLAASSGVYAILVLSVFAFALFVLWTPKVGQ